MWRTHFAFRIARIARGAIALSLLAGCARSDSETADSASSQRGRIVAREACRTDPALPRLGEPPLRQFGDSSDTEAVRFLWFPTFHGAVGVRAMRRGDAYSLISVQTSHYTSPDEVGRGASVRAFGQAMLATAGIVPEMIY